MIKQNGLNLINCLEHYKIPTPCFVYELEKIYEQIERIKNSFNGIEYTQYYPIKTNPCIDIVRYCLNCGLGLDACSMGDLEVADIFNVPSNRITFTGVGLNEQDMRILFRRKIIPNLSSLSEIERWADLFPGSQIGIRISSLVRGKEYGSEYALKMGIFPQNWTKVKKIVFSRGLKITKLHRHESRNSVSHEELLSSYAATFGEVPPWVWKTVERINFGGGWGLPYLRKEELSIEKLAQGIIALTEKLKSFNTLKSLKIEMEPGEFLVGYSGSLLATVLDVRILPSVLEEEDLQVVILDTTFPISSGFRSPQLLYPVDFESNSNDMKKKDKMLFTKIYGRSNTSMDIINKGIYLPEVKIGQLALVHWIGAYVPVLMSYFNQQDIPAEMILMDGKPVIIREKLDFISYYHKAYNIRRK